MTDKELLELAARAAGYKVEIFEGRPCIKYEDSSCTPKWRPWSPLQFDGDAFRLACLVGIDVFPQCRDEYDDMFAAAIKSNQDGLEICSTREPHSGIPGAATRRAIVRAAAEIGKAMK